MKDSLERLVYTGEWPMRLLDVGAQVGAFSRHVVDLFPTCKPTLIEANPNCEHFLRQTGFPYRIMAASDRVGRAPLYLERKDPISPGASLYREQTPHYADQLFETIEVELQPLDAVFPDENFDFIKIDVQGSELDVLRGARGLLERARFVLIELSLAEYNAGAPLAGPVIDEMRARGFRMEDIFEYHRFPELYGGCIFQIDILFARSRTTASQRPILAPDGTRKPLIEFLRNAKKRDPNFKVIDIGASANPWSLPLIDAAFDKFPPQSHAQSLEGLTFFKGDLNRESDWAPLFDHVAKHGRFDYAICTHTLEDLAYPTATLRNLGLIAEAGLIAVPALTTELAKVESGPWRGYIHHRWLIDYDFAKNRMVFYPKLPLIEHLAGRPHPASLPTERLELQVYWRGRPDFEIANDDYMGPSVDAVVEMFMSRFADLSGGRRT